MIKVLKFKVSKQKNTIYEELVIGNISSSLANTLLNSLRRMIMAFTEGTAIFGIRAKDIWIHKFDNSIHILENTTVITNRFKDIQIVHNNKLDPIVNHITVKVKGPVELKAGMLTNAEKGFIVVNKDLLLFTVTTDKEFDLDIYFNTGTGFVVCSDNSNKIQELFNDNSIMDITSIYSRLDNVNFTIDKSEIIIDNKVQGIVSIRHSGIYSIGYVIREAIQKMIDNYVKLMEDFKIESNKVISMLDYKNEILASIKEKFGQVTEEFIGSLDFMNYEQLLNLIHKVTFKECGLTRVRFKELLDYINEEFNKEKNSLNNKLSNNETQVE